jgi:hypothetical protein
VTARSGGLEHRFGPEVWARRTRLTVAGLFALAVLVSLTRIISLL